METSELKQPIEDRPYNRIGTSGDRELPYALTTCNLKSVSWNRFGRTNWFPTHASARRAAKAQPIPFYDAIKAQWT